MTSEERGFLSALKKSPKDVTARSAYADWLDEQGRHYEAARQREKAGISEVFYKLRRKSDGLFSNAKRPNVRHPMQWSVKGKMWRTLAALHAHLRGPEVVKTYGGTPWDDVEAVFIEVRVTFTVTLPVATPPHPRWSYLVPTVIEPLGGTNSEGDADATPP